MVDEWVFVVKAKDMDPGLIYVVRFCVWHLGSTEEVPILEELRCKLEFVPRQG